MGWMGRNCQGLLTTIIQELINFLLQIVHLTTYVCIIGVYVINIFKGVRLLNLTKKDQSRIFKYFSFLQINFHSEWLFLKRSLLKPSTELRYHRKMLTLMDYLLQDNSLV